MQILTFIINIEHAGDVLDRNVMMLAGKALKRGLLLSAEGRSEIKQMLERLIGNTATASAVFIAEDSRAARRLVEEKGAFGPWKMRQPNHISRGCEMAGSIQPRRALCILI
jgi:phosphate:Na+ symporter